jgi:hypothetical protein
MATSANVNKDLQGNPLMFFSRFYDENSNGVDVFKQQLHLLEEVFCFPPIPIVGRLLKHLEAQKVSCVLVLPKIWAPWRNLVDSHTLASFVLAQPYAGSFFTVTHPSGRRIQKKYPHAMEVLFVSFE